jgi:hypothetical protein
MKTVIHPVPSPQSSVIITSSLLDMLPQYAYLLLIFFHNETLEVLCLHNTSSSH